MKNTTKKIIEKLAQKISHLEPPIHLLAVCTGGTMVAKIINSYLRKNGVNSKYYEIWTNIICGKKEIWKTNFSKSDYIGTVVIVEDVIWQGSALPPIKKLLRTMNPKKKVYTVSLLDCNKKADYSIFN